MRWCLRTASEKALPPSEPLHAKDSNVLGFDWMQSGMQSAGPMPMWPRQTRRRSSLSSIHGKN